MKVWYFDNGDFSGVFSSKEKALDSLHTGAERYGWKNVAVTDYGDWAEIYFTYYEFNGTAYDNVCYIFSYNLDEDNFGG